MTNEKFPEDINLIYKDSSPADASQDQEAPREHAEVGASSLYGRRGDNVTFHVQGAWEQGRFERMWHWVWKDLGKTFTGLFRIFFPGNK